MYDRKEHITLNKIVREDQLFFGQQTKLAEILQEMGFHYKKINNRGYYYEQPHIIEQRHIYLCRMLQNRADKKPVVFLDETWANSHDGKDLAWVEEDTVTGGTLGGVRRPSGYSI